MMQPERIAALAARTDSDQTTEDAADAAMVTHSSDHPAAVEALVAGVAAVLDLTPAARLHRLELAVGAASLVIELNSDPLTPSSPVEPRPAGPGSDPPDSAGPDSVADSPGHHELVNVPAPIVGIFYDAPSPGAAPFCAPGTVVEVGQQLGIVEAMKMMNEIVAPCAGTVVSIEADSGTVLEFGQSVFMLSPER